MKIIIISFNRMEKIRKLLYGLIVIIVFYFDFYKIYVYIFEGDV